MSYHTFATIFTAIETDAPRHAMHASEPIEVLWKTSWNQRCFKRLLMRHLDRVGARCESSGC